MKKIINGRVYDTDTAKELGSWDNGLGSGDFAVEIETLYRKRTGEYFIYGWGGPASRYARQVGQSAWAAGERIMPLSYDDAREWAESHLEADDYIAIFGDPGEDGDGEVTISVRVPASVKRALQSECSRRGITQADGIAQAIKSWKE